MAAPPALIAAVLTAVQRCLLCCALALSLLSTRAQAQADLAGTYKAGTTVTKVDVSTWGDDCGPRPRDMSEPSKAEVTVKRAGTQLAIVFHDRTVRTDGCWSPNPAVRVASSTATAERWRTECQTAASDAKRERGVYTLTASAEGVLDLLEESHYDWQLNQSRCVAKIRVTQRLARGAATAELDKPAPAPAPSPVEPTPACTPGPLAKLRMRVSSSRSSEGAARGDLRIGPGEKACFSVRGFDAKGCVVPELGALKWELSKPAGASGSMSGACFKAASSAAEAEGQFRVTVSAGSVHDESTLVVATTDLSDITARRNNDGSEPEEVGSEGSTSSFGIEAAVKRSSAAVKLALGALLLGMLVGLGWFVTRSKRPERISDIGFADTRAGDGESRRPAAAPRPVTPSAPSAGAGEQLICPVCRHGYPGGTTACPRDGAVPIPYAEFTRKAQENAAGPRTCTACGAQLAAGALFCGSCGAKVHS